MDSRTPHSKRAACHTRADAEYFTTDYTDVRLPIIVMFAFDWFSYSFDSCDSW